MSCKHALDTRPRVNSNVFFVFPATSGWHHGVDRTARRSIVSIAIRLVILYMIITVTTVFCLFCFSGLFHQGVFLFFSPIIVLAISMSAAIVLMSLRIAVVFMPTNGANRRRPSQRIQRRLPAASNPLEVDGAGDRPTAVWGVSSIDGSQGGSGAEKKFSSNARCSSTNESDSGEVGDEVQEELPNIPCDPSSDEGSPGEFDEALMVVDLPAILFLIPIFLQILKCRKFHFVPKASPPFCSSFYGCPSSLRF